MNCEPTKAEIRMVREYVHGPGSEGKTLDPATIDLMRDFRYGFLNAGGSGHMPAMTLLAIAAFSGEIRAQRAPVVIETPAEPKWEEEPAVDTDSELQKILRDMGAEGEPEVDEEPADPPEPVAGVPEESDDDFDSLRRNRMINYREKGKVRQGRYWGPAKDKNCILVVAAHRSQPFAVHKKNVEIPDLAKPQPTTY